MATVVVDLSMSLDGFIAAPNDNKEQGLGTGGEVLHEWYFNGDTAYLRKNSMNLKPAEGSYEIVDEMYTDTGSMVVGRRMYDLVEGWGGNHPIPNIPVYVVTHQPPANPPKGHTPLHYVTDGVESAIQQAKAAAGDKNVVMQGANVSQQGIKAGLVDELLIHVVPVLLGGGVRLFDHLGTQPIELETLQVTKAVGVTHLRFRVVK
ncbi:MAG: dihydrofolate reductase [Burkholderiales bacterium]|nr:dihydrofolate reductase [Anaerolineae bacterium]